MKPGLYSINRVQGCFHNNTSRSSSYAALSSYAQCGRLVTSDLEKWKGRKGEVLSTLY
jgi:hypothetical protein